VTGLRILVCGGRDYTDRARVERILDRVHSERGIAAIIQGAARGADQLAAEWGWDRGVTVCSYAADWQAHGKKAGAIRNQRMIDEGKPSAVIAFPGGTGTADMVRRSRDAGLAVWVIAP
jgi:hypothetical protein